MSEWLDIMLEEIERRRHEAKEALDEAERRKEASKSGDSSQQSGEVAQEFRR